VKPIAYLTGRSWRGQVMAEGELPALETPDYQLLCEAGAAHGLGFVVRYWDDESIDARDYAGAVIRSCWDYTTRVEEFLARIAALERAGLRVMNPSAILAWNARKTYLRALAAPTIDTIWSDRLDEAQVSAAFDAFDAAEIVAKPQVGAGASGALRLKRNAWSSADLARGPQGAAMLQPFLASIETEGERSLFWFGDQYSHAVRKVPEQSVWLANQFGATRYFEEAPPRSARDVAEAARASMPAGAFYVRVDLVCADAGDWRVIEVEAIEPYLFLAFAPAGADVFAAALSRVLSP